MRLWLNRVGDETLLRITLGVMMAGLFLAYFAENIFIVVPPGYAAVRWSRFFGGTVTEQVYPEGMHIFLPWDRATLYDVRAQHLSRQIESLTHDGLHIALTLDVRFHPIIDQLGQLQRNLGPEYLDTLIAPMAASFARQQIARFTAEEVYATQRTYIERIILDFMRLNRTIVVREGVSGVPFINYDAVFINKIVLPVTLQAAIESKVAQLEATKEWVYRVERERLESQRRLVQAEGTRDVLATLGEKLSETFVRLRYVEMLETISGSPASKLIVTAPGGIGPAIVTGTEGNAPPIVATPPAGATLPRLPDMPSFGAPAVPR